MKQGNMKARGRLGPGAMYHMMMLPGILFLLVFSYVPMVGIITAFQDYIPAKGMFGSEFVGLKHFTYMFKLPDIAQVVSNTLVIAIGKILLGTMMAIIFSVLLNEIRVKYVKNRCRRSFIYRTFYPGLYWHRSLSTCSVWMAL